MTVRTKLSTITIFLVFSLSFLSIPARASSYASNSSESANPAVAYSTRNGDVPSGDLREVDINGLVTLPVVQQPQGNNMFVSPLQDYVTEYQTASSFGTVGLLAHNYLAGRHFLQILPGQEISLVYDKDRIENYIVTEIHRYQALVPDSPSSDFIDLTTGEYLTASQLFKEIYINHSGDLILQTCISANQNQSWGRLFIVAEPAE